jgi:putative DNA primase/helicase
VSQVIARLLVRVAATSAYQPLVAVHLHGISKLPELITAIDIARKSGNPFLVFFCEGEKDVDNARLRGLMATTVPGCVSEWPAGMAEVFRDVDVVVLEDNDVKGRIRADHACAALQGVAASIRRFIVSDKPEGDVTDFFEGGGTADDLLRMAMESPFWAPDEQAAPEEEEEEAKEPSKKAFTAKTADVEDVNGFVLNEDGIALAFTQKHRDDLRYCHHTGSWFHWNGARWQKEETKLAFSWAREVCRQLGAVVN